MAGNKPAIEQVVKWLEAWRDGPPAKRAILLYGPPGVGKTVISEAVAKERGWEIVEVNASEKRSGDILSRIVGLASTQASLFQKGRVILLDEVDGINLREDHGAIQAVIGMIRSTSYPVILTANDPWDQKIRPLRDVCMLIELKKIGLRDGLPFLKKILEKEDVRFEEEALRAIIEKDSGDLRSILTDLQTLSGEKRGLTLKDIDYVSFRDRTENIFSVLRVVFNAKTVAYARRALNMSEVDPDMLFQWIFENTPYQICKPNELSEAMQNLADADMFLSRGRRTQNWHLVSYAYDLMTGGVAMSKQTPVYGWVPMKFPQRIMAMSRSRGARELRKSVGLKIGARTHVSSRRAIQQYLPLLRLIHDRNPEEYRGMVEWLKARSELDEYFGDGMPEQGRTPKKAGSKPRRKDKAKPKAAAPE